jgi:hypothetical protein
MNIDKRIDSRKIKAENGKLIEFHTEVEAKQLVGELCPKGAAKHPQLSFVVNTRMSVPDE